MNLDKLTNTQRFVLSIALDAVGFIPFTDIVWAPVSAYMMTKMYKGAAGKYAAVFSFLEEAIPGTDFIPSFTIMWLLTFLFDKNKNDEQVVEGE